MPMKGEDLDYELLRKIDELNSTNQRDLAAQMGVSLGKVNFCLRAVIDRGWVKANNFRRADNKLAYAYLLTPSGAKAKMKMARDFLRRKEFEFQQLQDEIERLRTEVSQEPGNT